MTYYFGAITSYVPHGNRETQESDRQAIEAASGSQWNSDSFAMVPMGEGWVISHEGRIASPIYYFDLPPSSLSIEDRDGDGDPDVGVTLEDGTQVFIDGITSDLACIYFSQREFNQGEIPLLQFISEDPESPYGIQKRAGWLAEQVRSNGVFQARRPEGDISYCPTFACLDGGGGKWDRASWDNASVAYIRESYPDVEPKAFNHWYTFHKLAVHFMEERLPQLIEEGREELTILYPASGFHLAPLEAAFSFLAQSLLRKVKFINKRPVSKPFGSRNPVRGWLVLFVSVTG